MKYQIGDRVLVRDDLEYGSFVCYAMEDYDALDRDVPSGWNLTVVIGMKKYFGEEVEIVDIWDDGSGLDGAYIIEHPVHGRDDSHGWTDGMFVGLAEDATWEAPDLAAFLA